MFFSPFEGCRICKEYVLLDQTQRDCAREHDCKVENCPLARFFAQTREGSPLGNGRTEEPEK